MTKRTIEHKASNTAGYTCFSRACASREKDERFRGPDNLAEIFLPLGARVILGVPLFRWLFMRKIAPPGIYEYVLARTKLLDEVFIHALRNRFAQIVLLGAGFDTRALRFTNENLGSKIFELDIYTTQQPKVEILNRKQIELPKELLFVPIDFNKDSMTDVLGKAGYGTNEKSLFILEGVTMYLTSDAVDRTLGFIRSSAMEGSIVAFDYVYASVLRRENRFYGEKEIYELVSGAGEGWTFGIEEGTIEDFLTQRGFKLMTHYTPSDLEKRYLTAEDGRRFGHVNRTHCIVTASVCKDFVKPKNASEIAFPSGF
jgi:methyltransferase (TIGR00027 family)